MRSLLVLFFAVNCIGCQPTETTPVEATPVVVTSPVTISTPDMHCENCAGTIAETLQRQPGVTDVVTDVDRKTATITFDPSAFDFDLSTAALEEKGFGDVEVTETGVEQGAADASDADGA